MSETFFLATRVRCGAVRWWHSIHPSIHPSPCSNPFLRDTSPQEATTQEILAGCKNLAPELLSANGEFEVLAVQVGLRPSRKGGPRVESEIVEGRYNVVHSYGHAGAGYVYIYVCVCCPTFVFSRGVFCGGGGGKRHFLKCWLLERFHEVDVIDFF